MCMRSNLIKGTIITSFTFQFTSEFQLEPIEDVAHKHTAISSVIREHLHALTLIEPEGSTDAWSVLSNLHAVTLSRCSCVMSSGMNYTLSETRLRLL